MQENEESTGSEKVLILPLNEGSKKITQVLSNDRAMKVLEFLADTPMSATDVADRMGMPLTTIKYNIDALVEADLIKVKQTKWSKKGREIKIYEPVQKIIVVAPGSMKGDKSSILSMLKKYLVMAGGAIFAATGLEALTNHLNIGPDTAPMASSFQSSEQRDPAAPAGKETFAYDVTEEEGPEAEAFEESITEQSVDGQDHDIAESLSTDEMLIADNVDTETISSVIPNESIDSGTGILSDGLNSSIVSRTPVAGDSHMVADNVSMVPQPVSGLIPQDLLSHASVWFLLGCLFVISLLFIREIYYRNKEI
ncbi:ArsR/SmtB family transcription factor [Methanolobus halotolerans]|uniref:Helix-turn-helix domain-containing protein n=1 Tax=Methanolobus halotolerans TaxID=2052935 RepID=A0A4E0Q8G7_9EURY|nr:helix-turn-helix domain-containing protein [Methanolobus halotolerans]TGC11160.1 hypothetical protein CUN85_03200 [Methanolobus halotolerans]